MNKKYIFITIVVLVLVGGGIAYYQFNRGHESMSEVKADVTISAAELVEAFSADENAANQKYLNKNIAVTGKVLKNEKTEGGAVNLVLEGSMINNVVCEIDPRYKEELPAEGETATVQGVCSGSLGDVILVRSEPVKK